MLKKWKRIISMFMTVVLIGGFCTSPVSVMATDFVLESVDDTTGAKFTEKEQKENAINMLNYLISLTQEIQECSGSKLYMEEIFNSIVNNIHPNAVDALTLNEVQSMLQSLKNYRMIDVNRERLEYILEQDKAQAFREAVPDPISLLSLSRTKNPLKIAASVAYMAIDAKTGYDTATAKAEMDYLSNNWELDGKAYEILADSSTDLFAYMVNIVNENNLDGDKSLNQEMVKDFVKWKNASNVTSKIQHFESAAKSYVAYRYFGPFWLELAECYFENGDYRKCLESIDKYESLGIRIFRRDYELAKVLPKGIVAAKEVLTSKKYIATADKYCAEILDNSKTSDWASRSFVAETYMTLYAETADKTYIKSAYDIVIDNVNNLIEEQKTRNDLYLMEVDEKKADKNATKNQKEEIKAYNKMLKNVRETELAPLSEPLLLNCELLFSLAGQLKIDRKEKTRVDKILHPRGEALFLNPIIDNMYRFDSKASDLTADKIRIEFNGKSIALPAIYLTDDSEIKVSVSGNKSSVKDWKIDKVKRKKEKNIDTFTAYYSSENATKVKYEGGETIEISILPKDAVGAQPLKFNFKVTRSKRIGILDKWKWLDRASEWSDEIRFERVDV